MTDIEDPLGALDRAARKMDSEEKGAKAVSDARSRLIVGKEPKHAFFATLALRLEPEPDWKIETLTTDGKTLRYNPDYFLAHSPEVQVGLITHEVMHPAMGHHARRGNRDAKLWNIATDLAVNPLLLNSGFKLPPGALFPGKMPYEKFPNGLSAEEYYRLLEKEGDEGQEQGQGQGGEGQGEGQGKGQGKGQGQGQPSPDPGKCGGVEDAGDGSPSDAKTAEAEWEVAVAQAKEIAKQRGVLSAGLARMVEQILAPKVDWKDQLREFISKHARSDHSWSRPRRSLMAQGIYLPGLHSQILGEIAVAVDTSGSIGQKELNLFASEIQGILDAYDVTLTIIYHDSAVCHIQNWKSSDGPLRLEPKGGGGTNHKPVFAWLEKQDEVPTCLVCLTDLYSCFPDRAPDYPVLWASTVQGKVGPWGQTLEVICD